jgi:importin subunit alpha-2
MRTVAWTMSNLCRYKNPHVVAFAVVEKLAPILAILIHHPDLNVVCDVCWASGYISDGAEERIDLVLKLGVLDRLVELASGNEMSLIAPALRCLGNIVTGDDNQTQTVVDRGVLQTVLPFALTSNKPGLTREACWLMSNICAGVQSQIQAVLESGLVPQVVHLLETGDFRTQSEAAWVVYNICSGGSAEQACELLHHGALINVCHLLKIRDVRVLLLTLDTLGLMFSILEKLGHLEQATLIVEECGGLDHIEQLQNHENEEVYSKALQLVEKYFTGTENEDPKGGGDAAIRFQNPGADTNEGFNF